ncbi:MAG TPA: hypothetical protein VNA25_12145, partial [Phycisphaerae bacterium]|nr:hypothetical protein [Phycisphaerae bacterium]
MKPYQFALQECANLFDGCCCMRGERMCLIKEDKRCRYFEKCILPLADQLGPKDDLGLQGRREDARNI